MAITFLKSMIMRLLNRDTNTSQPDPGKNSAKSFMAKQKAEACLGRFGSTLFSTKVSLAKGMAKFQI